MATTVKTRTFCCTKETEEHLEYLREKLGETNSNIIKRAISCLYKQIRMWQDPESFKGVIIKD